jgi:hypothetical protein
VTLTLSAPTGLAVASLSPAQVVVTVGTVATPTPTPAV